MESRNTNMQAIFSELSEKNKDIVILIARSMRVAQEAAEQSPKYSVQTTQNSQKTLSRTEV